MTFSRWGMRFWNLKIVLSQEQKLKSFLEKIKLKAAKEILEFWDKNDISDEIVQSAFMAKLSSDIWQRMVKSQTRLKFHSILKIGFN